METKEPEVLTDASLKDQIKKVSSMNRKERRDRIRYFSKMFKDHLKRKPKSRVDEVDEDKQKEYVKRVNTWIMRYGVLVRKLRELHGFEGDSQGSK